MPGRCAGYIEKSEELQKKIMDRMRELGMSPIVPGFSGYIPKAATKLYPAAEVIAMKPWDGFPAEDGTYMLSPLSRDFVQIGKMFIREYRRLYGQTHFYLADAFNEMTVPVTEEGQYKELSNFGRAIYNSVAAGDSNGVWVMQGWLFNSDAKFWDEASVKAFLRDVPDNRMIIIDLSNESFHGWKNSTGSTGRNGSTALFTISAATTRCSATFRSMPPIQSTCLSDSAHGNLVGFGISPEGTENNEVVYELLTDMGWVSEPLDLQKWIAGYCMSRYGAYPGNMKLGWEYLLKSVYSSGMGAPLFFYQRGPELSPYHSGLYSEDFNKAVGLFLSCAGSLKGSDLYRDDAIELAAQYAGNTVDSLLNLAVDAQTKRISKYETARLPWLSG